MSKSTFPTYTLKAQIKMKAVRARVGSLRPIRDLQDPNYTLVTRDSDVKIIHGEYPKSREYDSFLIYGNYEQVWGFNGTPYLDKRAERVA